jgi:PAS domain S-box-containing protein
MDIYGAVYQNAPDPILLVDWDGRILEVNAQGEKVLGYGHDELIGLMVETLVPQSLVGVHARDTWRRPIRGLWGWV